MTADNWQLATGNWVTRMRLGVVVVPHGQLAAELVNSAEMIVGDLPHFTAVSIGWHDDVDLAREEIGRAIERVRTVASRSVAGGDGADGEAADVLVVSDMFGGTPANLAVTYVSPHVEVITGVNLPMLIKLARPPAGLGLQALAREMREHGRNAIWVASDLLGGQKA